MKKQNKRRREGVLGKDAGTTDKEGFIAPSIGAMQHGLYFTTAPSVTEKANQVLNEGRLLLPGVVVVWDETIGRRKGTKAIPKGWWADAGSLTAAFAFPRATIKPKDWLNQTADAVIRVIDSFGPKAVASFQPPNDLFLGDKKIGAVFVESHAKANLAIVRLNCNTDFTKAPPAIAGNACRLIDFIDIKQLPLKMPTTLQNTLLTRLLSEIPKELGAVQ